MGQSGSILASGIIGYEIGRRIGLLDELISEFSNDERFIKYQYILRPNIPREIKSKLDTSIILLFFIIILWLFSNEPFLISMVLTACIYAFSYDFCRYLKDNTVSGRVINLLYSNGNIVWSLVTGR